MNPIRWWQSATFAKRAKIAAGVVAVLAFVTSYSHIFELAYRVGENLLAAILIPLIIDVTVIAGIYTGLAAAAEGRKRGLWSGLALWGGGTATIAANLASSANNVTAKLVAVTAPVFLIIAIEVLTYLTSKVETSEPAKAIPVAQFVRENPTLSLDEIIEATGADRDYARKLRKMYGQSPE